MKRLLILILISICCVSFGATGPDWLQIKNPPVYDIRSYGVITGGEIGTQLQAAIDAAGTAGGGTVYIPPGTFTVARLGPVSTGYCINVPYNNVHITGAGIDTTTLLAPAETGFITHSPLIAIGSHSGVTNCSISNMTINGRQELNDAVTGGTPPQVDQWSPGVLLWNADRTVVSNMKIYNCAGDGVWMGAYYEATQKGCMSSRVENCQIYGNRRQGIALTVGRDCKILNNQIEGSIQVELDTYAVQIDHIISGNRGYYASPMSASDQTRKTNLEISIKATATFEDSIDRYSGIIVENNTVYNMYLPPSVGIMVHKNHFIMNATANDDNEELLFMLATNYASIIGNFFEVQEATSIASGVIAIWGCENIIIKDNLVNNLAVPFIYYNSYTLNASSPYALNHVIKDNLITGTGKHAIINTMEPSVRRSLFKLDWDNGSGTVSFAGGEIIPVPLVASSGGNLLFYPPGGVRGSDIWQLNFHNPISRTGMASFTGAYEDLAFFKVVASSTTQYKVVTPYVAFAAATPTYSLWNPASDALHVLFDIWW